MVKSVYTFFLNIVIMFFMYSIAYNCYSQWPPNNYDYRIVEFFCGDTEFGTKSLKISEDGLLMRYSRGGVGGPKRIVFIPIRKINYKKLVCLQSFLWENDKIISELDTVVNPDNTIVIGSNPDRYFIRCGNRVKSYFIVDYYGENVLLKSLKFYMNEIIPNNYKNKFNI